HHDPDDPAAGGSNAFAPAAQALLQLSPLLGVLLAVGGPSGVFWESHRTRPGALYPDARGGVASAPVAGCRPVAMGASAALAGERSTGRVSAAQRWAALSGGGQYLERQAQQATPLAKKGRLNDYAPFTFGLQV